MIEKYNPTRHNTEEVKNLLAMAIGRPTDERLKNLLDVVYDIEGYFLYVSTDNGKTTGIIGVDDSAAPHGWILHLAVHPDYRKQGIGRDLIKQAMEMLSLNTVGLETDWDAINFYRACNFNAVEIPGKWPGVHRFRCTKGKPPKSVLEYYDNKELPH